MGQRGNWYDGQVALEWPVDVRPSSRGLVLIDELGSAHMVDRSELVRLAGGRLPRFGHRSIEGWRLVLQEPVDPEVAKLLPGKSGALATGYRPRTIGFLAGVSAIVSAFAGLVIFAPETIARQMPISWERKLGGAFDLPIDFARCGNPRASEALHRIVDRLDPKARTDGLSIELVELDEANAAALPGGRMVVLTGLFDEVADADAVAGIVAHEIAHVRRRHVAAAMVRDLGLGAVVTLLGGGAVASNASGLLSLKFSRTAEAEADADAVEMLRAAGIDPRPTAKAFETFRKSEGDFPEWLASHPASAGRAEHFTASYRRGADYRPVLSPESAKSLMSACRRG